MANTRATADKSRRASGGSKSAPLPYEATEKERASLAELKAKRATLRPLPKLKSESAAKGSLTVSFDHPDEDTAILLTMNALGVSRHDDLNTLLRDVGNIVSEKGSVGAAELNAGLSLIEGIGPRDTVEMLLATQMLAVHHATMTAARHLKASTSIPQQDSNGTCSTSSCGPSPRRSRP